jgi:hypothetical protein
MMTLENILNRIATVGGQSPYATTSVYRKAHAVTRMGLECIKQLLATDCENDQPPANSALPLRVLMMILRRQGMPFRNTDLIATSCASVNARIGCLHARGMVSIERFTQILLKKISVFI